MQDFSKKDHLNTQLKILNSLFFTTKFAWLPKKLVNGKILWLKEYYAVSVRFFYREDPRPETPLDWEFVEGLGRYHNYDMTEHDIGKQILEYHSDLISKLAEIRKYLNEISN